MNGEGDGQSWLTGWEQQCADSIEEQPDFEQTLTLESDDSQRKIWNVFQDSATAIAQLYRDRYTADPGTLWISFQTAAGTVTSLYKESCDTIKKSSEISKQVGYQRRNRELLSWAKRKKTLIRREDLLAYLSGKPPPPRHHHHHTTHTHRLSPRPRNISPPPGMPMAQGDPELSDLNTFREALARSPSSRRPLGSDLCAFIAGEIQRHCKRPASPSDVTMGSPSHQKRPRYM
ncbi:PREDICTED: UPF0472 protein C16orf72 homolog isoform X2 [Nicrophorus vespilloides]|nr:PREDICTED: UPF0472 protein C16orf72 homolog isoform X2 [Nicrophorus vespilloides]XP_017781588.1 PREDICTED: UPF0472 protein C16orf72 homolog isoform X2 [Nicrophorus vespilloides]